MMDEELFALEKKVREITKWDGDTVEYKTLAIVHHYSSDYLLEKLCATKCLVTLEQSSKECLAIYRKPTNKSGENDAFDYWTVASATNTPLKALLKLVLALKKAGEI